MVFLSLVTIRMNGMFLCPTCYGQKLFFFCTEIETKINTSSVKESAKDEISIIFLKSDIYDWF